MFPSSLFFHIFIHLFIFAPPPAGLRVSPASHSVLLRFIHLFICNFLFRRIEFLKNAQ